MVDAWANSDLSSTMEMFTDSLSELLSDNTESPTFEIENACFTTLWDSSEMMVVGFAWMQDGYMILGPDIDGIGVHSTELGIDYLVGDNARNAQASASNLESLVSLAPPSQHDVRNIDELVGIDQEESSDFAVPGLGIYATLTVLCLSAILAKRD